MRYACVRAARIDRLGRERFPLPIIISDSIDRGGDHVRTNLTPSQFLLCHLPIEEIGHLRQSHTRDSDASAFNTSNAHSFVAFGKQHQIQQRYVTWYARTRGQTRMRVIKWIEIQGAWMRYNEPMMMSLIFSIQFFRIYCRHTEIYTCHTCNTRNCAIKRSNIQYWQRRKKLKRFLCTRIQAWAPAPANQFETHTRNAHTYSIGLATELILMHTFSFGYTSNLLFYCSVYSFHSAWRVRRSIGHTFKRQREQKRTEEKMPSARHRRHYDTHIQILNVIME